jgi:hypothetical protein
MAGRLQKSSLATASKVKIGKDSDAVKAQLSEQDIREKPPWDLRASAPRQSSRGASHTMTG